MKENYSTANNAPLSFSIAKNTLPNPPRPISSPFVQFLMIESPLRGELFNFDCDDGAVSGGIRLSEVASV